MPSKNVQKKDWFNTYLYIYLILAVVVPLLFVASIVFQKKQVAIQVVEPRKFDSNLSQIQEIDLKNAQKGQISSQNIGLEYEEFKVVQLKILNSGIERAVIDINAGDTVVFVNASSRPITIIGQGWGSGQAITPTKSFGQKFDFVGEYSYEVNGLSGKIIVK